MSSPPDSSHLAALGVDSAALRPSYARGEPRPRSRGHSRQHSHSGQQAHHSAATAAASSSSMLSPPLSAATAAHAADAFPPLTPDAHLFPAYDRRSHRPSAADEGEAASPRHHPLQHSAAMQQWPSPQAITVAAAAEERKESSAHQSSPPPPSAVAAAASTSSSGVHPTLLTVGAPFRKFDLDAASGALRVTEVVVFTSGIGRAGIVHWIPAATLASSASPPAPLQSLSPSGLEPRSQLPLRKITAILVHKKSPALRATLTDESVKEDACFALVTDDYTLSLEATSKQQRIQWQRAITNILAEQPPTPAAAAAAGAAAASSSSAPSAGLAASPVPYTLSGGLATSLVAGRVLEAVAPSSFHSVMHFLFRFGALACMLTCAMIRVNLWGAAWLALFFFSIGLIAFKRFSPLPPPSSSRPEPELLPIPRLSPLRPFMLPGFLLSLLGLLALSVLQLCRRFLPDSGGHALRGEWLRQFGMHYTEPMDGSNVAVLFVPYFLACVFFLLGLAYESWMQRWVQWTLRTSAQRRESDARDLAAFKKAQLDDPIRKLDELTSDPKAKSFTPEQKKTHEAKIRARYETKLAASLAEKKARDKRNTKRHKSSAPHGGLEGSTVSESGIGLVSLTKHHWSWFECKVFHPLWHIGASTLVLICGILERSVLSYIYFAVWSILVLKWSLVDRASFYSLRPEAQTKEARMKVAAPVRAQDGAGANGREAGIELAGRKAATTNGTGHTRQPSALTIVVSPVGAIRSSVGANAATPAAAAGPTVADPPPSSLCSSFFPAFPSYSSFPLVSKRLFLLRVYQCVWWYSALHLLLKYIFRGLFIFDYGSSPAFQNTPMLADMASPDRLARSHLLFFLGRWSFPSAMDGAATIYLEEGFHIGCLFALNLYLGLILHLSRKPYVFLPTEWGRSLFATKLSVALEARAKQAAKRSREQRVAAREERKKREAAAGAASAKSPFSSVGSSSSFGSSPSFSSRSPGSAASGSMRGSSRRTRSVQIVEPKIAGIVADRGSATSWPSDASLLSPEPEAKPLPPMSFFEKLCTALGRTLWLLQPSGCFMLAMLYSAYPSLGYLLAMFLSSYFSLSVSFRLLPLLELYTLGLSHTFYIFHLPNNFWDDSTGSDYLEHVTTSYFVALLLSALGVVFFATAHKYARDAVLFWERRHGFEPGSLSSTQPGESPLGLLSPSLGQTCVSDEALRKQAAARIEQRRKDEEAAVAAAAAAAQSKLDPAASEPPDDAAEAVHFLYSPEDSSPAPQAPAFHDSSATPAGSLDEQKAAATASSPSSAMITPTIVVSPPPAAAPSMTVPAAPAEPAESKQEPQRHDDPFQIVMSPIRGSPSASASTRSPFDDAKSPESAQLADFLSGKMRMRENASTRAKAKLAAHAGFASTEAYAAAMIQASYRGRKARKELESAGIPVVAPEERKIMQELQEEEEKRKQQPPHRRHRRHASQHHHRKTSSMSASIATLAAADAAAASASRPTSLKSKVLGQIKSLLMTLALVFFSYSNLLLMLLLYVLGILRVDLIHACYMLLFLAYAISPWMRRNHGVVLIYASLVIFVEYAWTLTFIRDADETNNEWTDRVGLVPVRPFNRLLYPHVAVVLIAGIFHRFSPEEAASAQLRLNRIEEAKLRKAKKKRKAAQHAAMKAAMLSQGLEPVSPADSDASPLASSAPTTTAVVEEEEDDDSVLSSSFALSPLDPFYRTIVTAGLVLCTAVTLWAGLVNSLMSDSIDPVDTLAAAVADPQGEFVVGRDLGVSLIALIYLFFVFALLLIHQIRPGIKAFGWDRFLLLLLCIYSGLIVILQYTYQFTVLDQVMADLSTYTSGKFTAAEIGIFKTGGSLYRSLLSHSVVLFVCVGELRLLRLDVDPHPKPGSSTNSISLSSGKHGSSVENLLELFEAVLLKTERRIEKEGAERQRLRTAKLARKQQLADRQRRKIEAFENNDFAALNGVEDDEIAEKAAEEAKRGTMLPGHDPTSPKARHRHMHKTLLMHFMARVGYYSLLFIDWFLLQHSDKLLALTLFLVAINRNDFMGAWYLILAFFTLLILGFPRLKALLCIVSAQIFILAQLAWQFPANAFSEEGGGEDLVFRLIGLRKESTFGLLVVHHIAVMLMGSFFGTSYFWLRVHQRKTMRKNQQEELASYQEAMEKQKAKAEQEAHDKERQILDGTGANDDEEGAAASTATAPPSVVLAPIAATTPMPPPSVGGRFRGASMQMSAPPTAASAATDLLPSLLATLPSPAQVDPTNLAADPLMLTPAQHSTLVLYNHLASRQAANAFVTSHAHPSSQRDETIQDLQAMNLDILMQSNVGPSERKGRARYQPPAKPSASATAAAPGFMSPEVGDVTVQAHQLAVAAAMQQQQQEQGKTPVPRSRAGSFAQQSSGPAAGSSSAAAPLADVAEDATGELSNSDAEENPLKHVKSWMMRVPLQETSHRLNRDAKEAQRRKQMQQRGAEIERVAGTEDDSRPKHVRARTMSSFSPAVPRRGSIGARPADVPSSAPVDNAAPMSWPSKTSPGVAAPAAPATATTSPASSLSTFSSPHTLNDEARVFSLASSAVRLNQLDPSSKVFELNLKYHATRTGDEDDREFTKAEEDAAFKAAGVGDPARFVNLNKPNPSGDVTGGPPHSSSPSLLMLHSSRSFWPRMLHGLLGPSGFVGFVSRFIHYFGFFHLALMSLLCASYSNANTIFSLYYIAVTGWLSYVGTQTANRYWRPLVASLTLCIIVKYALSLANEAPDYRCGTQENGLTGGAVSSGKCSRWLIWLGKGTHLYYWDAWAWLMVVIHHSALRIYAKIEAEVVERRRKEREEPWEIRTALTHPGDADNPVPQSFSNPIEQAAFEGTAEGAVESYKVRSPGEEPCSDTEETGGLIKKPPALNGINGTHAGPFGNASNEAALVRSLSPLSATSSSALSPTHVHKFSPAVQFPPFQALGSGTTKAEKKPGKAHRHHTPASSPKGTGAVVSYKQKRSDEHVDPLLRHIQPNGELDAEEQLSSTSDSSAVSSEEEDSESPAKAASPVDAVPAAAARVSSLERGLDSPGTEGGGLPGLNLFGSDEPKDEHALLYDGHASPDASASPKRASPAELVPLSPSGYPSYRPIISQIDPIPSYITVTFTTIHNQLSSYVIGNFMDAVTRDTSLGGEPCTVSEYCHYLVFRSAHYLALLLVIALCTTYFNLLNASYLVLAFVMFWEGDHILDGRKRFRWDQFYILSFVIIAVRLLYQMPVFRLSRVVTNWSSVLGLYKVNKDDCVYDSGLNNDKCDLSVWAGLIENAIILDILIFGVVLVMRTLLARREMVFVRSYIKVQRKVAAIRLELISLGIEADRLGRTIREQNEAISRLVRVKQLKELKIARQEALEAAREASGQNQLIAGWEESGRTLGVRRAKGSRDQDEDAMARSSIRNHAINQIRFAAIDMGSPNPPEIAASAATMTPSAPPPLSGGYVQPAPMEENALFPVLPPLGQPLETGPGTGLSLQKTVVPEGSEEEEEMEALRDLAARKKRYSIVGGVPAVAADTAAKISEDDVSMPLLARQLTHAAPPRTPKAAAKEYDVKVEAVHPPHEHTAAASPTDDPTEDPETYRAALAASEFELHLVEARMAKLRRKRVIQKLNRQDEVPLLALKFYELPWVQSMASIFTSTKHAVFNDTDATNGAGDEAPKIPDPEEPNAEDLAAEHKRDIEARRRAIRVDEAARGGPEEEEAETPKDDDSAHKKEKADCKKKKAAAKHPAPQTVTVIEPSAGATVSITTQGAPPSAAVAAAAASSAAAAAPSTAPSLHVDSGTASGSASATSSQPPTPSSSAARAPIARASTAFFMSHSRVDDPVENERMGLTSPQAVPLGPEARVQEVELKQLPARTQQPSGDNKLSAAADAASTLSSAAGARSMPDGATAVDQTTVAESARGERNVVIAAPSAVALRKGAAGSGAADPFASDSDLDDDDDLVPEPSLPAQVWELFSAIVLNSTWFLVVFFFLLEFLVQPSILSVIYPFSLFLYGLLTYPRPPRLFWETMIVYTCMLIVLKFVWQFPCFCICQSIYGQLYSLCAYSTQLSCPITTTGITVPNSATSAETIIGLHKIRGGREHAQDGEFMLFIGGVFLDFCTLFALGFHRRYLRIHGLWLKQSQVDQRKRQHEQLMRKLVKHGLLKESVRKWQRKHAKAELALQKEQALSVADSNGEGDAWFKKPTFAVMPSAAQQREGSTAKLHGITHAKDDASDVGTGAAARTRPTLRRAVSFSGPSSKPAAPMPATAFNGSAKPAVTIVGMEDAAKAQQIKLKRSGRIHSSRRLSAYVKMGDKAANFIPAESPQPVTKPPVERRLQRTGSMPDLHTAKANKLSDETDKPKRSFSLFGLKKAATIAAPAAAATKVRSTSPPDPDSDHAPDQSTAPPTRVATWKTRMSDLMSKGSERIRGVLKKKRSEGAQGDEETGPLLPEKEGTAETKPKDKSASLVADRKKGVTSSAAALALERHRLEARKRLRKQVAAAKETRFQRSLRRMTRSQRAEALTKHRLEQAAEDERVARADEKAEKRLKRKQAEVDAEEEDLKDGIVGNLDKQAPWPKRYLALFYRRVRDTSYKPGTDLYIYIFLIQLLQFVVLVIFYNLSNSAGSLTQNYISPQFVLVIFAQFVHIIVERVVYLYRALFSKLLLQVATMVTFFIIALYEGLGSALLQVIYILMCVYWLLSALQFYHGFPASTQGQFLAKSTHVVPSTLFMAYRAIPFVFELRTLLDWICTDTVLFFGQWLKFEDIYATFFLTQCACDARRNNPQHAGQKQGWLAKLGIGLGLFILLVIVVWGPLFLFSSQAATSTNPVTSTRFQVSIPGYLPLYTSSENWIVAAPGTLGDQYLSDRGYATLVDRSGFLSSQRPRGLQIIYSLSAGSTTWAVSPLARSSLVHQLTSAAETGVSALTLEFDYSFVRDVSTAAPNTALRHTYTLSAFQMLQLARIMNGTALTLTPGTVQNATDTTSAASSSTGAAGGNGNIPPQQLRRRRRLLQASGSTGTFVADSVASESVFLPGCYPAFFFMSSIDRKGGVDQLSFSDQDGYNNCLLSLRTSVSALGVRTESWVIEDAGSFGQVGRGNTAVTAASLLSYQAGRYDPFVTPIPPIAITPSESLATDYPGVNIGPPLYMYSGEIPSGSSLNLGLVGVYVTVVLAIGRFLRMYVMGTSKNVMWDDLQDARPVLNMCRDLYTARLHMQLKLEQQLYVELINLLRSPETLLARTGEYIHYWPKDDTTSEESSSSEEEQVQSDSAVQSTESDSDDSDGDTPAQSPRTAAAINPRA